MNNPSTISADGAQLRLRQAASKAVLRDAASRLPHHPSQVRLRLILLTIALLALFLFAPPRTVSALVFRPEKVAAQWDTWMYYHGGTYYLYYLATERSPGEGFCLATSADGVHWTERGMIFPKASDADWLGTGAVWKSADFVNDKKFLCNFSEWRGPRQTISFAESSDLIHWTRLGQGYEFKQDPRWYQENGRWDCIYAISQPGGGYLGYWTADPKRGPGVGFGRSVDGRKWQALEPPKFEGGAPHGEAGAVEKIAGKWYLMLGAGGMVTLIADRPEGPFRPAAKNRNLLSGDTYFSRFFPTPDGLLVTHHSITHQRLATGRPVCYTAPLKRALVDTEGTLRLGYWTGNDKLKGDRVEVKRAAGNTDFAFLPGQFNIGCGTVLEGTIEVPNSANDKPVGLYVEYSKGTGKAILVGPQGVTEIGAMREGKDFQRQDRIDREASFSRNVRFRLLLRHCLAEFYIDDILIQCFSMPERATGRVALVKPAAIDNLKAWTMSLGTS